MHIYSERWAVSRYEGPQSWPITAQNRQCTGKPPDSDSVPYLYFLSVFTRTAHFFHRQAPDTIILMPISANVVPGQGVKIFQPDLVNLYGCTLGGDTQVGAFVEIQKDAFIARWRKISSHSFICEGVTIEDDVFVGPGVMFVNDLYPRATTDGRLQTEQDWHVMPTGVKRGASIGAAW